MAITILLWDLESDMNLGLATRDCYMLGADLVNLVIFDPHDVVSTKAQTIRRFASFATDHFREVQRFQSRPAVLDWLRAHAGRVICAVPDEHHAVALTEFRFRPGDLIVFGNEYYGVPDEVIALAQTQLVIPMRGAPYERPDLDGKVRRVGTQRCLSLSSSLSIVLFRAILDTNGYAGWRRTGCTRSGHEDA